jgi:hypothetical protein
MTENCQKMDNDSVSDDESSEYEASPEQSDDSEPEAGDEEPELGRVKSEKFEVSDFLELEMKKEREDATELLCPLCLKLFSQRANLQKHILTVHEGRKDFECEFCGKQVKLFSFF